MRKHEDVKKARLESIQEMETGQVEDDLKTGTRALVRWNAVASSGGPTPKPRHGHRAVSIRDLMIVFGGGNDGIIDELHVYSATTNQWFVPEVRGEAPRGAAAYGIVCDAQLRIFTFGGMAEEGHYSNDLYELQTKRWEWKRVKARPPPTGYGPCARLGHSFTLDSREQVAYLFGGLARAPEQGEPQNGPYYLNDLYCLDLKTSNSNAIQWSIPQTNGAVPSPRESHSAVFYEDQASGKRQLIVFGGMAGVRLGDLRVLDLNTLEWSNPYVAGPPPIPRSLHTANIVGNRMFIFGGWAPIDKHEEAEWNCSNSLAVLDKLDTPNPEWVEAELAAATGSDSPAVITPEARAGHCSAVINKRIYVWSGRDGYKRAEGGAGQACFDDMHYLETEKPVPPAHIQLIRANTNSLEVAWSAVSNADSYLVQIQKQYQVLSPHGQLPAVKGTTAGVPRVVRQVPSSAVGPHHQRPQQQIIRVVPSGTPNVDGIGRRTIVVTKPSPAQQPGGRAVGELGEANIGASPTLVQYVQPHSQQTSHSAAGEWHGGASVAPQPPPTFSTPPKTTYITPTVLKKDIDQSMPTNILDEALNEAEIFDGLEQSSEPSVTKVEREHKGSVENGNPAQRGATGSEAVAKSEEGGGKEVDGEACSSSPPHGSQPGPKETGTNTKTEEEPHLSEAAAAEASAPPTQQPPPTEGDEPKEYFNLTPVQPTRRLQLPERSLPQKIHASEAVPEDPVGGQPPQLQRQEISNVLEAVEAAETTELAEKPKTPPAWCDVGVLGSTSLTITHYSKPGTRLQPTLPPCVADQQTGLEPGTLYKLRIAAINSLGQGDFSPPTNLRTCLPGFPGAPTSIKIVKCVDGASLSWEEPHVTNGSIQEYTVYLAVRPSNGTQLTARGATPSTTSPQAAFTRVYAGLEPQCIVVASTSVAHDRLALAHVDSSALKPAVIFRIAAKNEKGYGPATQVRWLQDINRLAAGASPAGYTPISTPIQVAGQRRSYSSRESTTYYGQQGGTPRLITQTSPASQTSQQPHPQYNNKRLRLE